MNISGSRRSVISSIDNGSSSRRSLVDGVDGTNDDSGKDNNGPPLSVVETNPDLEILSASQERQKKKTLDSLLTANRLQFDRLRGLFGREMEITTLKHLLKDLEKPKPTLVDDGADKEGKNEDTVEERRSSFLLRRSLTGKEQQQGSLECNQRELVLISGHSGTGKSALAMEMKRPVERVGGIYCCGKYDVNQQQQKQNQQEKESDLARIKDESIADDESRSSFVELPFVGIVAACKDLCLEVLQLQYTDLKLFQPLQQELISKLGAENIDLLSLLVKQVRDIVTTRTTSTDGADETNKLTDAASMGDAEKKERLAAAFRIFFKVIATFLAPVVVVLDDLQWADQASLDTIQTLMTDSENTGLMIIGCYRSDEVYDGHQLVKTLKALKTISQDKSVPSESTFSVTEIDIGNLSLDDLVEFLCEVLSKDHDEVQKLAQLCITRTDGNIFYVKEFLSMLVSQGYLKFHVGTFQWDWNISAIEQETSVTSNMIQLISSRMLRIQKINPDVIQLLKLAACLGNTFHIDILRILWDHYRENRTENSTSSGLLSLEEIDEKFRSALQVAVEDLLLMPLTSTSTTKTDMASYFRFAHDKIQESALSLIPEAEFKGVQNMVGRILLNKLPASTLEEMLFVVVNLINRGEAAKTLETARLNCRAAKKAKDLATFSSALNFVQHGISHLPPREQWDKTAESLQLTIDLYCLGAFAEMSLGRPDKALKYCNVVLAQDKATIMQKLPAYKSKLDVIHSESGKAPEALDLCLEVLSSLGCKIPRRKFVVKAILGPYMKTTLSQYVPLLSHAESLPIMTDPVKLEIVELLERAGSSAFLAVETDLYTLLRCRLLRMLAEGLYPSAASGLASFSNVLMHKYGAYEKAIEIAHLGLEMQRMLPSFYEARTIVTAYFYVLGWVTPIRSILNHLLFAYESGARSGNMFMACTAQMLFLYAEYSASVSLETLCQDYNIFGAQMARLERTVSLESVRPIWQLSLNLLGRSGNTTLLTGDALNEQDAESNKKIHVVVFLPRCKCFAYLFFGEYVNGADIVLKIGGIEFIKDNFPGVGFGLESLPFGVCCYAAARQLQTTNGDSSATKRRRKYRQMADSIRKATRNYVKKGCINLVHVLSLLDAEYFALARKVDTARECYERGILEAARGGFLFSAAVGSERYSDYLYSIAATEAKSCINEAEYRLDDAIKYYKEWGAVRVVEHLEGRKQSNNRY